MYVAIVADNVADRKQAERLLDRANTALASDIGTLYVSAFGDEASFLRACMKFDLFLLDFDHDPQHSLDIVDKLKEMNAPGVCAICKAEDEPFSYETAIAGVYYIDKPILTAPLHKLLCDVYQQVEEKRRQNTLIELRCELDTHYVPKDEILYIVIDESARKLAYHLTDDRVIELSGNMNDVAKAVGSYPEFLIKIKNICFNTFHIKEENKKSILLSNGECFSYPLLHQLFG